MGLKLNLGCGYDRREGWLNVDSMAQCQPDQVVDLESFPLPWGDGTVSKILLKHVLEHLGQTPAIYLKFVQELYRISQPDAEITIIVPHPRHNHYLNDPTHVRPITPQGLQMFSQKLNRDWVAKNLGNSPLGLYLEVDFEMVSVRYNADEPWRSQLQSGRLSQDGLMEAERLYNNVIAEITIQLKAVKPAGSRG